MVVTSTHAGALCHRVNDAGEREFLLIRTSRGDRWVFPKGRRERGEPTWQTAARETAEESGWYGEIEREPLADVLYCKPGARREHLVTVHLLAVSRWRGPCEDRARCWVSSGEARRLFAEGRAPRHAAELARLIARAEAALART